MNLEMSALILVQIRVKVRRLAPILLLHVHFSYYKKFVSIENVKLLALVFSQVIIILSSLMIRNQLFSSALHILDLGMTKNGYFVSPLLQNHFPGS